MNVGKQSSKLAQILFSVVLIIVLISISTLSGPVEINNPNYEPDSSYAAYFPLKVGNSYTYYFYNSPPYPPPPYKYRAKISRDTFINGKKYFYCENFPSIGNGWVRFDTLSGNLLKYTPGYSCSVYQNHIIVDSLKSRINDQVFCLYLAIYSRKCIDTSMFNVFNLYSRKSKLFEYSGLIYCNIKYAKNFGIVYFCSGEPPPCQGFYNLTGCVLDGVVYGDTTLTIAKLINSNVPEKFMLEQNYPNPFNAMTNFKFDIPLWNGEGEKFVTVKIYDISGKKITTLINEELQPGTYAVRWDATGCASGVYFYTLTAREFRETKSMILIK